MVGVFLNKLHVSYTNVSDRIYLDLTMYITKRALYEKPNQ